MLPEGRTLPDDAWRSRHRALLVLLCLHALGLPIFGVALGYGPLHSLLHGGVLLVIAGLALLVKTNRRVASAFVSVGLVTSSALLVHIWGGVIEGHFHFFVVIVLLSLYEDWLPFLLAAAYVVVHHGLTGALDPDAVYNHADAVAHPWKWAAIHGLFVTAAGIASVTAWRLNEGIRGETKEAYRQARESEERFRSAFEEAPIGMTLACIKGDPGRFMQVNRAMCEMIGYSEQELLGKHFRDITHPDDLEKSDRLFGRVLAGEAPSLRLEKRYLHADGHTVWALLNLSLVRDSSGEPLYAIAQVEDITERRSAERELKEHKDRLQAILDNATAVIYAKDSDGRFLFVNRQFEKLLGVTAEETVGTTDHDLMPPAVADAVRVNDRKVLETGEPLEIEEVVPLNGEPRTYNSTKFPLRDDAGLPYAVCSISTDITERKRAEAELAEKAEVERANKAKSEFLSRVSHELRTPLNAILGFAQLLEIDSLDRGQQENVGHILKGGRHLLDLINEILDISRIESGNMAISLEPVHLQTAVRDVVDLVRPLASEREVAIEAELGGSDELHVWADHQRLRQVLLNLLSNAVKYNHVGGVATISWNGGAEDRLRILIGDNGPGISQEQLTRLFSPFERLGAERSAVEGTGLGLALSKLLVEAMGGTLEVESELGAGATFAVDLALAEAPQSILDQADVPLPVPAASDSPPAVHTVLHVEDNFSNFQVVERALATRSDVKLLGALDGDAGLELAKAHRPDLVLLDLHLPGMAGDELLERLKADQNTQDIPVVIVSADATPRQIERLLQRGASAYLTKPLDIKLFLEVVQEHLNGRNGA